MNSNYIKVIGMTRLGITPESTAREAVALTAQPSELLNEMGALHQGTDIHLQTSLLYVPILTYGHDCCIMNEKVRSRIEAAGMGVLRRFSGLTMLDKITRADIPLSLIIELLVLRLERIIATALACTVHVTRISLERKNQKKLLSSTPVGQRPTDRPRTR